MKAVSTSDRLQLLGQAPLFNDLEPEILEAAFEVARFRTFERGNFLFHQGEPATLFYVVLEGRVRLVQVTPEGHQVIVRYLGPGDGMGIIVALSNVVYPVSAEAVDDCQLLGWDGDTTADLMLQYPRLALNGMRLIASRFAELQDRYRELATERVERRIARTLLRLVRQVGKRTPEGILIDMTLSRQDLAEMTGTTLYTVSRVLSRWEGDGLVSGGRERVVILNAHALVVIAEDLPEGDGLHGSG